MNAAEDRARTEARLRRIEALVTDLGRISDPVAREHARELFEALLDLHGVALARIMAGVARAAGGRELLDRLGCDEQVRPVLLLHGLHPDDLETRVRQAVATLRAKGSDIVLTRLSDRTAVVRIASAAIDREDVEAVLYEAAPDLDRLEVEVGQADPAAFDAAVAVGR